MQQGSARPLAVTYMRVHGRRHNDHGDPLSLRLRLNPGSEAAPDALNFTPSDLATAFARSMWTVSSRESCS